MENIYIRLEIPPKGMNHARSVEGRAAAKNWAKLRTFALESNARPLDDFLSKDVPGVAGAWFRPAEALKTLRTLMTRITADKRAIDNVRLLIHDLHNYENILSAADARGSKFRFSVLEDQSPK